METQAFIAHILKYMDGSVHGRIQLQKLVYFCKAYGVHVDANYKLYIYGPYSQQVADSLQDGVMEDIFQESKGTISKGPDFEEYIQKLAHGNSLGKEQADIMDQVLKIFADMHNDQLELLATTFFIYRQQNFLFGKAEKETVLDKVRRAKASRFSETQIMNAFIDMEKICLPLILKTQN